MIKTEDLKSWGKFLRIYKFYGFILIVVMIIIYIIIIPFCRSYFGEKGKQQATAPLTQKESIPESYEKRHSGILLKNNIIMDCKVGVSMPRGADVEMDGNKFVNNQKSVEVRD